MSTRTTVRSAQEVRVLVTQALRLHGATETDADTQADQLVEAELRGHPSHGLRRLPVLVARLQAGLIVSGLPIEATWTGHASLAIDGRRGFGPVVATAAIELLLSRVDEQGITMASIRNAGHVGMLAPYVEKFAEAGFIGIALTTSEALVHPWGGVGALVGTNPIGIAVPAPDGPVVLDMSTGAVSRGKINDHAARGIDIPAGWGIDADGEATTSASSVDAISPFGGAKGYALGIALEVLVATLTQSAVGRDVRGTLDTEHPVTKGDVFICISPPANLDTARNIAHYLDQVRASGPDVTVPGDRARATKVRHEKHGIPVDDELWGQLTSLTQ